MLTVHQLRTLFEFDGYHSLSSTDEESLAEHESLEKFGLLERCAVSGARKFFRATPLGTSAINAASAAANKVLDPEAPGPFCDCGREMYCSCSCPVCDNDE